MTLFDLYDRAEGQGIEVDDVPMRALVSASFPEGWIAMDSSKIQSAAEEKTLLAHELSHIETGSFYNIYSKYDLKSKCEYKANAHAIQLLIPQSQLRKAFRRGITEIWELAEHFGVTEDFVRQTVEYYAAGKLN